MHCSASARIWRARVRAASVAIMQRRALALLCAVWLVASGSASASAGVASRRSHRVTNGDSLWKIARAYQCSVDDLRRVNRLDGNTIQPGQRLRIPSCKESRDETPRRRMAALDTARPRAARERLEAERPRRDDGRTDDGKETGDGESDADAGDTDRPADAEAGDAEAGDAEAGDAEAGDPAEASADDWRGSDAVRDGGDATDIVDESESSEKRGRAREPGREMVAIGVPLRGQSFGRPQNGYLVSGRRMPRDPAAYFLRRPERAWGADHTVDQLRRAIRQVRRRYPRVHPLAIGDLSARHGGRLTMHGSHQSGRDADVGFYFRRPPRGYPRGFAVATADNLDFSANWALLSALCKTADKPLGVERIYMTYSTQALFYRLARKHGVSRARLAEWFQYPHGRRADHGIIRHEPGHTEHIHVRFRCAPSDPECE
jgi:murein endopeptidase